MTSLHWRHRVGNQRDWVWRGWQTRYTYLRAAKPGSTTPLILLHGFGASIGHWRNNLDALAEHHTVYALDMLGFGASEKACASYKTDLWVEQVYDFWQTFIQTPVVLVGNSIGSLICMAAAAAHPDMVAGVVMISLPDLSMEEEALPKPLRPLVASVKRLILSPLLLRALFPLVRRPKFVRTWASIAYAQPTAITDELIDILAGPPQDRGSAQAFAAIFRAVTDARYSPHIRTVLPTLTVPMLLLWGQQDRMIPKQFARPSQYGEYNPNLKLIELENAGHCPHDECPEQVNEAILDWLVSWKLERGEERIAKVEE
ncbi:alpha/beta fold hydrolase [Phormidium sp. FACHB-592]|uniref:Alpha/beta fold hydrolase n=1 Tax=Stenomitos frigidus AS-A4 TaxID=2933935 RepID=A0ABV0KFQ4_9CYAN|nr:alpha/beta fold hydrolase [Phormidium sp. FACHB-592]MBD2076657.1 alpha/beta fold hydrolase [Phormidium sp. FACHB-592]